MQSTMPFRLSGPVAAKLGLPTGTWNHLEGTSGVRVTDRTYYVDGVDLVEAGVQRGDLLVLNNGESFVIDRILSDVLDPAPNPILLLRRPADTALLGHSALVAAPKSTTHAGPTW